MPTQLNHFTVKCSALKASFSVRINRFRFNKIKNALTVTFCISALLTLYTGLLGYCYYSGIQYTYTSFDESISIWLQNQNHHLHSNTSLNPKAPLALLYNFKFQRTDDI